MAAARSVQPATSPGSSDTDDASGPSSRTRSVWLLQLVLGASVIITVLLVQALDPSLFAVWTFSSGVGVVIALTAVAIMVPWHRLPRNTVALVPFGDIIGIGLLSFGTDLRFGYFWVFPITWIATHFILSMMIASLATAGVIIVADAAVNGVGPCTLR